jgi:hypothetical protein
MFTDTERFDFHLSKSSPAIYAGTVEKAITTDFEGVQRPQGSGYDIGSYEYGQ